MDELVRLLRSGNHSLVVGNGGRVEAFDGRGVSDLLMLLYGSDGLLRGAKVADKVVGKGAAALMVLGGVVEVYAEVMSRRASELLGKYGMVFSYGELVPDIINRRGDGVCPVEELCTPCATAEECLPLIKKFVESMKNKK